MLARISARAVDHVHSRTKERQTKTPPWGRFLDIMNRLGLLYLLDVLHVLAAIRNHLEKSSARARVLLVFLEMGCEFVNALGKEGYLDL